MATDRDRDRIHDDAQAVRQAQELIRQHLNAIDELLAIEARHAERLYQSAL